jgi:HYR domain
MRRHHVWKVLAVATTIGAIGAGAQMTTATATTGGSKLATSELVLKAKLRLNSMIGGCSSPAPGDECAARTGSGVVSGLGAVTEKYEFPVGLGPPACAQSDGRALASSNRFVVAGKGEIHFTLADGGCMVQQGIYNEPQAYSITGGTGVYAGASGSGTVERNLGEPAYNGRSGPETWTGTLSVPGLEFDTTPPTFTGATNKTARAAKGAKTRRVRFTVTAHDERDVVAPVARCTPGSGGRFRIGRTRVVCEATDSSGNTGRTSFVVTVKRTR